MTTANHHESCGFCHGSDHEHGACQPLEFTREDRLWRLRSETWDNDEHPESSASYDTTEADLAAAGFVRASRLAAAEAMVRSLQHRLRLLVIDARTVSEEYRLERLSDGDIEDLEAAVRKGQMVLDASRPSEQASKEDSGWTDQAVVMSRISELETQLAEAKRSLRGYEQNEQIAAPHRERLRALLTDATMGAHLYAAAADKLEAAEAERAHLLEAAEILRRCERHNRDEEHLTLEAMNHLMHTELFDWYGRDQSRAAAATEEPKPESALCIHCLKPVHEGRCGLPNPQGARLGGHYLNRAWQHHVLDRRARGVTDGSQLTDADHAFIELWHAVRSLEERK